MKNILKNLYIVLVSAFVCVTKAYAVTTEGQVLGSTDKPTETSGTLEKVLLYGGGCLLIVAVIGIVYYFLSRRRS